MGNQRVLIIDDEEGIRTSLGLYLEAEGYAVRTADGADEALRRVGEESFDVIVSDVRMPGRDGLDLLPDLRQAQPEATILIMSAYGAVEQALEAVRNGAADYLAKPFQPEELLLTMRKTEERDKLRRENQRLRTELEAGSAPFVAASTGMQEVFGLVERATEYKTTVLVTGESGVGKEVIARAIHEMSSRAAQSFIAVNCGAIAESLIESELFGHARGAFTGAEGARRGMFREADGGTLFLDEIGELSLAMQVKLLRVLQEEEVRPVGEPKSVSVDVRIIAATARSLEDEIKAGRFRDDLYYRLNVFRVHIPPLRDRLDDIPLLVDRFVQTLSRRMGREAPTVDDDVLAALSGYDWPGNVRELENMLERALILTRGDRLQRAVFPGLGPGEVPPDSFGASEGDEDLSIKRGSRRLEDRLIRLALARTGGNRTQAARILEISPRALQYKLKEYGIAPLNPSSR